MEFDTVEVERGRAECESDITNGRLRYYWGTRGAWGEYASIQMSERFNVQINRVGCMTTLSQLSFEYGYNVRMREHITEAFGSGSFEKLIEDVEAFRKRNYQEHFPK